MYELYSHFEEEERRSLESIRKLFLEFEDPELGGKLLKLFKLLLAVLPDMELAMKIVMRAIELREEYGETIKKERGE